MSQFTLFDPKETSVVSAVPSKHAGAEKSQDAYPLDGSLLWFGVIGLAFIVFVFGPFLYGNFRFMARRPHYSYFPVIFAIVAYFIYTRFSLHSTHEWVSSARRLVPVCFLVALLMFVLGVYYASPSLGCMSLIFLVGGLLAHLRSQQRMPGAFGVWLVLCFSVPLPLQLDRFLITNLQSLSSIASSYLIDLVPIYHVMRGNVLELPQRQLFVDEACSGITSLISLQALAFAYAAFHRRSWLHTALLSVSGFFFAFLMNAMRISLIASLLQQFQLDLASGTPHEILGLILFACGFFGLVSFDRALCTLQSTLSKTEGPAVVKTGIRDAGGRGTLESQIGQSEVRQRWTQYGEFSDARSSAGPSQVAPRATFPVGKSISIAIVGLLSLSVYNWFVLTIGYNTPRIAIDNAHAIDEDDLPSRVGKFQMVSFEQSKRASGHQFGEFSKSYTFAGSNDQFVFSFDFPFFGEWHELTGCYRSGGWQVDSKRVARDADGWEYLVADMSNKSNEHGFLVFGFFDESGLPMDVPATETSDFWKRIMSRGRHFWEETIYQVQLFCPSNAVHGEARKAELQQAFEQLRTQARDAFVLDTNPS